MPLGRERLSSPQEMAWHRHTLCKTKPLLPCRSTNQMYLVVGRNNLTALSSKQLNKKKSKRYRQVKAGADKSNGQRISTTASHPFSGTGDMFITDTQNDFIQIKFATISAQLSGQARSADSFYMPSQPTIIYISPLIA